MEDSPVFPSTRQVQNVCFALNIAVPGNTPLSRSSTLLAYPPRIAQRFFTSLTVVWDNAG